MAHGIAARVAQASVVEWDQYETVTRWPPEVVTDWLRRGADPAEVEAPGLTRALIAARTRGPVLFETPFGRTHVLSGALIDTAIWIDLAVDTALARKLGQLLEAGAKRDWLAGYLAAYETVVRPSCEIQAARVAPQCDHRIVNDLPAAGLIDRVLALPPLAVLPRSGT
ncbi:hypothetical protein R5H30_01590 [Sulfitobacter sp. D35]|uniref:hypothetical protein n=1 Tax=Sulfitobacter sp. D35 TaxID=3083252 RepID=UPI00296E7FC5|nr:hypothetical protein [Sulfitobacter sp. D35]MDW4496658.1 hypothetical protein [Sulfitobacter sp. D35]